MRPRLRHGEVLKMVRFLSQPELSIEGKYVELAGGAQLERSGAKASRRRVSRV